MAERLADIVTQFENVRQFGSVFTAKGRTAASQEFVIDGKIRRNAGGSNHLVSWAVSWAVTFECRSNCLKYWSEWQDLNLRPPSSRTRFSTIGERRSSIAV